jgi:hypothetical protein
VGKVEQKNAIGFVGIVQFDFLICFEGFKRASRDLCKRYSNSYSQIVSSWARLANTLAKTVWQDKNKSGRK